MPQIDLASWSSPSRAVCPSGAHRQGLSIAMTVGRCSPTRSTTCLHVKCPWSTRTRRSSMTATSKPFRFPPTSTPTHAATRQACPTPVPRILTGPQDLTGRRLPSARPPLLPTATAARHPPEPGVSSGLWSYEGADGRSAACPDVDVPADPGLARAGVRSPGRSARRVRQGRRSPGTAGQNGG